MQSRAFQIFLTMLGKRGQEHDTPEMIGRLAEVAFDAVKAFECVEERRCPACQVRPYKTLMEDSDAVRSVQPLASHGGVLHSDSLT
jgi:hypothetical protein